MANCIAEDASEASTDSLYSYRNESKCRNSPTCAEVGASPADIFAKRPRPALTQGLIRSPVM